jgi:hypothetical protein
MIAMNQTWREVLVDAFEGVDRAYEHRTEVVQAAHDAGLSLRQIGAVVGMSAAGINRMVRKRGHQDDSIIDAPADLNGSAEKHDHP